MKFRKKPIVIEAVLWNGSNHEDVMELSNFGITIYERSHTCRIQTLEGDMTAGVGDWIIKGITGEIYSCKSDIFEQTYEPVEEET